MKFLAIIPARKGSKGLVNKNFKNLCKKPLIDYTVIAAQKSLFIDKIIISTDDKKIIKYSKKNKIDFVKRPEKLSQNNSKTIDAIHHVLRYLKKKKYIPDFIVTLQPTSPLRTAKHIDEAVKLFLSNPKADSLVSCQQVPHMFNPNSLYRFNNNFLKKTNNKKDKIFLREKKNKYYSRNGAAIYITKYKNVKKYIFGGKMLGYLMDKISSLDIDDIHDFNIAHMYISKKNLKF
jgi:CMP-N-acetylneuraminic acid synthetase